MSKQSTKKAPRITISVPAEIKQALIAHVAAHGKSESGFIADLLKRVLNVGGNAVSAEATRRLYELRDLLGWFAPSRVDSRILETSATFVMDELEQGNFQQGPLKESVPAFLLALLENPERMRSAVEGQDVYIPRVEYSCGNIQEALIAQTFKWNTTRPFGLNFKQIRPSEGAFDAIINLEFALSAKSIFPFPCFQTEFRRPLFGVIPYAVHKAVGWLVHKESLLSKMFQLDGTFKRDAMMLTPEAAAKRLQFLSELFERVSRGEIALFTRDNYLNREILPLLKANAHHGLFVSAFSAQKFATMVADNSQWPPATSKPESKEAKNSVFLYDLAADKELVVQSAKKGFFPIPFVHDQIIPVGVGFSLPALPLMARKIQPSSNLTVAETLRDVVKQTISEDPARNEKAFWDDGILIDSDLRSAHGETDAEFSERMFSQ